MVPVSVRTPAEKNAYGNRVTSVLTELATDEADPVERLLRIHNAMNSAKRMREAIPADLLQDFTQFQSTLIAGRASRIIARTWIADRLNPPFNITISNVPGPREPLFLRGARLESMYPVSIVLEGQGLNITVISYRIGLISASRRAVSWSGLVGSDRRFEGRSQRTRAQGRGRTLTPPGRRPERRRSPEREHRSQEA